MIPAAGNSMRNEIGMPISPSTFAPQDFPTKRKLLAQAALDDSFPDGEIR
jgi:hypothetical protein